MSRDQTFKLGARLLGFYFVVLGLVALPGAVASWEAAQNPQMPHPWLYVASALAQATLTLAAGVYLLLRYRIASEQLTEKTVEPGPGAMGVGLKLIGIYFTVLGLGGVASALGSSVVGAASWAYLLSEWGRPLVWLGLGSVLVLHTGRIVRLLGRHESG